MARSSPFLPRLLRVGAKVLFVLAGAGGVVGGLACGVALARPATGASSYDGPAFFGFFLLLASAGLVFVALTLLSLGLALDPAARPLPRLLLASGAIVGLLSAVCFLLLFSDNSPFPPFWAVYPYLPLAGVALMLAGLAAHFSRARPGR